MAAREKEGTAARQALAGLCSAYWYPLYAFVRARGFNPQDAEDLTQEFFYRFLEKDSLAKVTPVGGKFRSFLLVCLKRFLVNEWERARAQRRGGGRLPIPLEGGEGETRYALEPQDRLTPELLFEKGWAFTVLDHTMKTREREYASKGKSEVFAQMKGFLPGGEGGASRAELAGERGVSAGSLDVAVHRLRQRFGTLLREQVARTVSSEEEVDDDIRYLISVLGS